MQNDGNLVLYAGNNKALWASNTARGKGNYVLVLQKDRNVVIYGNPIWATSTNICGTNSGVVVAASNATSAAVPVVVASADAGDVHDNRKIAMVTNRPNY
ncbi:hypothetical protein Cni_G06199 [Canna indica]|uniref:Bulb-type lectin domain-containing protein n=1 Tax=Canna indica TaxID=4628 RepID=A0AAQ3JWV6_9LILI|nr:hypothetical protein Cni_G06199 [Canna indica]